MGQGVQELPAFMKTVQEFLEPLIAGAIGSVMGGQQNEWGEKFTDFIDWMKGVKNNTIIKMNGSWGDTLPNFVDWMKGVRLDCTVHKKLLLRCDILLIPMTSRIIIVDRG
jgi:hypothetical protein